MQDRFKFRAFYQGRFIYKSLTDANYYDIVSEVSLSKNDLLDKTYIGHWLNPTFIEKPNDIIIY